MAEKIVRLEDIIKLAQAGNRIEGEVNQARITATCKVHPEAEIVEEKAPADLEKVGDTSHFFERLKESIEGSIGDLGAMNVDDQEIIDAAINLESKTMFFYDEIAKSTDNPKLKEFCKSLAKEAHMHFEVLQKIPDYAQDPSLLFTAGNRL